MDPSTTVKQAPRDAQLVQAGSSLRPGYDPSINEPALSVTEVSIAMRKDELLRLLQAGNRTRKCAEILGLGVNTVRTYIRCPEFQAMLHASSEKLWARVDEEIRQSKLATTLRIEEMSEKALEKLEQLMDSEDESIVFRASSDILDRNTNTSKHHKEEINKNIVIVDPAQLALAAATAREMEERSRGYRSVGPDTNPAPELEGK